MHCDALCFTVWRVFDTSLNIHDGSSFAGGWRNPETCDEGRFYARRTRVTDK